MDHLSWGSMGNDIPYTNTKNHDANYNENLDENLINIEMREIDINQMLHYYFEFKNLSDDWLYSFFNNGSTSHDKNEILATANKVVTFLEKTLKDELDNYVKCLNDKKIAFRHLPLYFQIGKKYIFDVYGEPICGIIKSKLYYNRGTQKCLQIEYLYVAYDNKTDSYRFSTSIYTYMYFNNIRC